MSSTEQAIAEVSPSKERILLAAMDLFCDQGVAGTSLQMIADSVGVTKAAVYYHFKTKKEIVMACGKLLVAKLDAVTRIAESQPTQQQAREVLVDELITVAVRNRRETSFLQSDPVMLEYVGMNSEFAQVIGKLQQILLGKSTSNADKVLVAAIQHAIGGAIIHPAVRDIDDESLHRYLKVAAMAILAKLS